MVFAGLSRSQLLLGALLSPENNKFVGEENISDRRRLGRRDCANFINENKNSGFVSGTSSFLTEGPRANHWQCNDSDAKIESFPLIPRSDFQNQNDDVNKQKTNQKKKPPC